MSNEITAPPLTVLPAASGTGVLVGELNAMFCTPNEDRSPRLSDMLYWAVTSGRRMGEYPPIDPDYFDAGACVKLARETAKRLSPHPVLGWAVWPADGGTGFIRAWPVLARFGFAPLRWPKHTVICQPDGSGYGLWSGKAHSDCRELFEDEFVDDALEKYDRARRTFPKWLAEYEADQEVAA